MTKKHTTVVMGEKRVQKKTSIFFDKGSTCSMVTKSLVERLELEALKRTLIVQSFRHTEAIDTEYVGIELLKTDGTVAHIRAYVVERITSMAKVMVPQEIRDEFGATAPWPEERFSGEVDILLGLEELALHPTRIEMQGNLGIFVSEP